MASEALSVVGRLKSTRSMVKAMCPGPTGEEVGRGRQPAKAVGKREDGSERR